MLPHECYSGKASLSCNGSIVMPHNLTARTRHCLTHMGKAVPLLYVIIFLCTQQSFAQELFISTEPASNMPRYSYGFRVSSESFAQDKLFKSRTDFEAMYGFSGNLMGHVMISASNFYGNYEYNNFGLYAKYRLYTDDGFKSHFRIAAYAHAAFGKQRNTFADIELRGGNTGLETGLIFTILKDHLALSSTLGAITFVPDINTGIYDQHDVIYTNVKNYLFSLSAGYLVYPKEYSNYSDLNVNVYAELMGKYITYEIPDLDFASHEHGMVLDLAIGPQIIINSISRLDLAITTRVISEVEGFPKPSFLLRYEQMFY
jgi:hypothetical protein